MCLAVPARVTSIEGNVAQCELEGNVLFVDLSLVPDVAVGDYVVVHAGIAIQRYDQVEALETLNLLREITVAEHRSKGGL